MENIRSEVKENLVESLRRGKNLPKEYKKSNILISEQMGLANLKASKLMLLTLVKVGKNEYDIDERGMYVILNMDDISSVIDATNQGSVYRDIKTAATILSRRQITLEDQESGKFQITNVFGSVDYDNGTMRITLTNDMAIYLVNLQNRYTKLPTMIMLSFQNDYTFRLYEMIRSVCFNHKGMNKDEFSMEMRISELRFKIGTISLSDEKNASAASYLQGKNVDYDKALAKVKSQKYPNWNDFHKNIVRPAVKEINEKSDLDVEYSIARSGLGGKTDSIVFVAKFKEMGEKKEIDVKEVPIVDEKTESFINKLNETILSELRLDRQDFLKIAKASDYDLTRCEKAIEVLNAYTGEIDSVVGFLIKAIEGKWTPAVKRDKIEKKEDPSKVPQYKRFQKRTDYDWDAMEQWLLHRDDPGETRNYYEYAEDFTNGRVSV